MKMYKDLERGDVVLHDGQDVIVEDVWRYGDGGERLSIIPVTGPEIFGFWAEEPVMLGAEENG